MALPGSPLLPLKEKWQPRSQVFWVGQGTWSTSSSSSSSSSTRPAGGVPGRPPREAPRAGHEGPGCPGTGAAASEEDAACGARELLAAVGKRNCIHHRVPLARGLFTWAWESARAGASSGCGLGEGSERRGRVPHAGMGDGGGTTRCGPERLSGLKWALAEPKAEAAQQLRRSGGRGNFPPACAGRAERMTWGREWSEAAIELRPQPLAGVATAAARTADTSNSAASALRLGLGSRFPGISEAALSPPSTLLPISRPQHPAF